MFESAADNWRHGLFIATEDELRTEGAISRAYTDFGLESDFTSLVFKIRVEPQR